MPQSFYSLLLALSIFTFSSQATIPAITVKDEPGSPHCGANEDCDRLFSGPLDFCSGFMCPGSGAGDGGLLDPKQPNPSARPPADSVNNNDKNNGPDRSCSQTSTKTNYRVSCESLAATSTLCTTTSSMLAVACDITATTKTTSKTSSSPPSATAADGCSKVGGSTGSTRRCWNKCDPGTGSAIGGDWATDDPWCYISKSGSDSYANCFKQSDCPADFECSESWGCVVPLARGCAAQGGNTGLAKTCWSSCNEKTGKRTNNEWKEGMPWCWLKNKRYFASCGEDDDCSATTECVPDHWTHGGCGA